MRLSGGRALRADRDRVWSALHDVECLQACVPGCVSVHRETPSRFAIEARIVLGPVTLPFAGVVEVIDAHPPEVLLLRGQGGGLAGRAIGTARLDLQEAAPGCYLAYTIEAERSGPFAFVASTLLAGVARSLTDRFATRFATMVEGLPPASPHPAPHARAP